MRKRDGVWIAAFANAIAESGGQIGAREKLVAATASDMVIAMTKDPERQQRMADIKFDVMIQKPDVREALRGLYAAVDFEPAEAMRLHVKHIRGEVTKEQIVASPEGPQVMEVRVPPSLPALKLYFDMTVPQPPKETVNRNLTLHASVRTAAMADAPPPDTALAAVPAGPRMIGDVIPARAMEPADEGELDDDDPDAAGPDGAPAPDHGENDDAE